MLVLRAPFKQSYLFGVMIEAMNRVLWHTHVPNGDLTLGIPSDGKDVLVDGIELADTETILRVLVRHHKFSGGFSQIPDLEVTIV